jgi:hypothetical protein
MNPIEFKLLPFRQLSPKKSSFPPVMPDLIRHPEASQPEKLDSGSSPELQYNDNNYFINRDRVKIFNLESYKLRLFHKPHLIKKINYV